MVKRKRLRISLREFLRTGNFGPFIPRRHISPEELIQILGEPDPIEVCSLAKADSYIAGNIDCYPVIVPYGGFEFHFDSPSTLLYIYYDNPFAKKPFGNSSFLLSDFSLLKYRQSIREFLNQCKSKRILVNPAKPYLPPYSVVIKTIGGVEVGFEVDDPEDKNEEATLRWFFLDLSPHSPD